MGLPLPCPPLSGNILPCPPSQAASFPDPPSQAASFPDPPPSQAASKLQQQQPEESDPALMQRVSLRLASGEPVMERKSTFQVTHVTNAPHPASP